MSLYGDRLYGVFCTMKTRCYNKRSEKYRYYGAKGIKVCPEWKDNFYAFRSWALANGYKYGLQLERKDTSRDYCPDNCCWATAKVQQNNRTNTKFLTAFGETKSLGNWVDDPRCIISYHTLYARVRKGWNAESALSIPCLSPRETSSAELYNRVRRKTHG